MSANAGEATSRRRAARSVLIREHRIPSANSAPYICVEGPDGNLWFCESGAAKIGRFDPRSGAFTEFALADAGATPIGIDLGPDGNLWFAQKKANKIGRMTPAGVLSRICRPDRKRRPRRHRARPGRQCLVLGNRGRPDRPHHAGRQITEFKTGISPGSKPLSIVVRDGALWFSEAAGNRVGRITVDGTVSEFDIPGADPQPRAMVTHPDGNIWFVETGANALGRLGRDGAFSEFKFPDAERLACAASRSAPTAISGAPRTSPTRSATWRRTAR